MRSDFLAEGLPSRGEAARGDHLQAAYRLWLPGHELERGGAPWLDPYSFRPESSARVNFAGWPFGLVFWPLERLFGLVGAWNLFVLLGYVGAGVFAALWLRALQLPPGAALAGGLAFALAPYLVAQSAAGHLLAPVSMLLPLTLFAWEWNSALLAGAALASIPLSGQVHLALGAIPFFLLYALVRRGRAAAALAVSGVAALTGLLVYAVSIRGTVGAGGRSFAQVERYSADWADFVARDPRHGLESAVFLGWVTPLVALAGLVVLLRTRRPRLAFVLGIGAVVPLLVALGAHLPGYEEVWRHAPGLRHTRVPERLMPIACLSIAGLVAVVVAWLRRPLVVAVAVALLFLDLRVDLYEPTPADPGNAAYAALQDQPSGRLLELPAYLPDDQRGSVYLYYATQAPRERPAGYSTTAPPEADLEMRVLRRLTCGRTARPGAFRAELARLGVRYVALHFGVSGCPFAAAGLGSQIGSSRRIVIVRAR